MPIRNAAGPRADYESKVLTAFLDTQSWEMRSADWDYRGNSPIDFIWCDEGIGVELGEWLDRLQAQWVAERDRFRNEIESEIVKRDLVQFQTGGRDPRCTVHGYVEQLPGGAKKQQVIDELIQFMVEFEKNHKTEICRPYGCVSVSGSQLPQSLSAYFTRLSFFGFLAQNLGVPLTKAFDIGQPARSDSALQSLTETLKAKIITKAETYRTEKQRVGLSELWLVIHYSSPGVFDGPMRELGMDVGYGTHRKASQESVAARAKTLLRKLGGGGPFDHVFLMIYCQPDPYVSRL
jgi:hypothetical protein